MEQNKSYLKLIIIAVIIFLIMVLIIKNVPQNTDEKTETKENHGEITNCTIYNFKEVVLNSKEEKVLVLFSRDIDPHRDKMREIMKKVADEDGQIKLAEVNTDSADTGNITSTYGVMVVPAIAYFKNGECVFIYEGSGTTEYDVKNMLQMK